MVNVVSDSSTRRKMFEYLVGVFGGIVVDDEKADIFFRDEVID